MSRASRILGRKLNERFKQKQDSTLKQPGVMGDGNNNLTVSGVNNFVYITVGNRAMPVFNNRVTPQIGLKVWVGYAPEEPTLFQVLSTRTETPAGTESGFTGYAPAKRYEWQATGGGQDPLYVQLRQMMPMRLGVSQTGGMNVDLFGGYVYDGADFISVPRQDIDLTSYIPVTSGKAAFVLITIDTSGAVVTTDGADVDIASLSVADIPSIPSSTLYICGAVRVYEGQAAVQDARTNTDFVDLRFLGMDSQGSGSGGDFVFRLDGALAVVDDVAYFLVTRATRIEKWYIHCDDPGTAGSTRYDVELVGTGSIFASTGDQPTLAYNDANGWAVSAMPNIVDFSEGDILAIHIKAIATDAEGLNGIGQLKNASGGNGSTYPTVHVLNQALTSKTTTSGSFVDHDASNSLITFTKLSGDTDLLVELDFPLYSTAINTAFEIAIHDGTTATLVIDGVINTANAWSLWSGRVKISGLAAGSVTLKVQWKRVSGSGTLTTDTNSGWSISVQEVN